MTHAAAMGRILATTAKLRAMDQLIAAALLALQSDLPEATKNAIKRALEQAGNTAHLTHAPMNADKFTKA